jgi:site-specific recombinase XerD
MPRSTPKTLTDAEVRQLFVTTERTECDLRDHVLLVLALTTGLRVSELVGLNLVDIRSGKGVKTVVTLRPETTRGRKQGEVVVPERTRRKLVGYVA